MLLIRKSWMMCLLVPALSIAGLSVQVCFCHDVDGHESHDHSGGASGESRSDHDHHGNHSESHHRGSSGETTLGSDSLCLCAALDSGQACLTGGGQRLLPKNDSLPRESDSISSLGHSSSSGQVIRSRLPGTPGGGHSPPCALFVLHARFLI